MKHLFKTLLIVAGITLSLPNAYAQNVGINTDGSLPAASAMLDVKNPNKGMLIPRAKRNPDDNR